MTDLLSRRRARLGPNVPTFYEDPVHIIRGEGVWLWDADGQRYLDCYNNVAHVGHGHPKVVEAIAAQQAQLCTHTRYLHGAILDYADRLCATLNHDLSQIILTCTGSEANDIALRMAQAVTGNTGIIATDNTYHGNTLATSQLSTRRPPIGGRPDHVRLVPAPCSIHPLGGTADAQPSVFARNVAQAITELDAAGHGFSGMMLCPVFANEGLPALRPGSFDATADVITKAGGLILCDEVQPGFGRLGTQFWGHEWLGIAPDVITIGKPMGNGYPVAGVVARPEIMTAFREAFGYFNTFGGNPVAAAAAMAVLDVIETEGLQDHAHETGAYMLAQLQTLRHPHIAEIRGLGLFFGIEFRDRAGQPDGALCARIVEEMRRQHVLIGRIGRKMHILKLRPPLPFGRSEADLVVETLARILADA